MADEHPINMYGATWCGDCKRAKAALQRFGTPYTWHDIESEQGAAETSVKISGQTHIPVIQFEDGSFLVEPSNNDLQAKLTELHIL